MRRLGKWMVATENELRDIVTAAMPETIARERATLMNQDLLRAAMAADQLIHSQVAGRDMTDGERTVCELLTTAIGAALRPTSE